jgi:hypothetical protein
MTSDVLVKVRQREGGIIEMMVSLAEAPGTDAWWQMASCSQNVFVLIQEDRQDNPARTLRET